MGVPMRSKILLLAMAFIMMLSSAAMAYNFEISPTGRVDVGAATSINFDVFFNPDPAGNTFGTYSFALFFDNSELQWNAASTTQTPPSPLTALFGDPYLDSADHISNFNGASFAADPTINTRTKLASVAFNIMNTDDDGIADVWFDKTQLSSFTIGGNSVSITDQNSNLGANVAPEPVSTILFLSGGAVMGIRRFWKKA